MKYGELFHFDPIEAIVQLKHADELQRAQALVDSYVVSEAMAQRLVDVVIPQLQFLRDEDNKGVFVVGNYGSGKSHLLSVLSSVAEHPSLAARIRHPAVAKAASDIAGRFAVLRVEVGTTTMSLRDILCARLEDFLARVGVTFRFPELHEVSGYKRAFEDMMAAFGAKHPDKGLLLVVDELLDFLRQRNDTGIAQDLSFLREIGESCRDLRLRFVAGIQEMLFDNPRFRFVNDSLRRVEARFRQVSIARDDVRFVVAARLLRKDDAQRAHIRAGLAPFTKFYGGMAERLETFVDLFPIHPDFLDVLERVPVVEKRVALTTVSFLARALQDETVPEDRPGVVSYDRFWESILRNPAWRSVPDIKAVIECSQVLEERVRANLTRPDEQRLALRIIYGLSVQRLAVGDVEQPIGPTAPQLRDGLCLYDPTIEGLSADSADDLATSVESMLQEIARVVSGQFLSTNPANDQWYLDLKKTEDYDALIAQRAVSLSGELRDRYWFEALKRVMELTDQTLVTGFRIWEHEVEWRERRASRRGYLLFGAPNERPTAQPPRDFYLYFMQPWKAPPFRDEKRPDELFFRLAGEPDDGLLRSLDVYAAASELQATASGSAKATYEKKAAEALRRVAEWIRQNLPTAFTVTHEGRSQNLAELLKKARIQLTPGARLNVRDLVNGVASFTFAAHFLDQAPRYPTFATLITSDNRNRAAAEALKALRGNGSRTGRAVLDALQLLDGDAVRAKSSPYAKAVLDLLQARPPGKVVNRPELLGLRDGVEYDVLFRLEPEWFVVVLAALVHAGEITIALPRGKKLDAGEIDALVQTPVDDLIDLQHIERPRVWNRTMLVGLFELVGLAPGQANSVAEGIDADEHFRALHTHALALQAEVVEAQRRLKEGVLFWGRPLLDDDTAKQYLARADALRVALDAVGNLRAAGQLKTLPWDADDVRARAADLALVRTVAALHALVAEHSAATSWLTIAAATLPESDPWVSVCAAQQGNLLAILLDPERRLKPATSAEVGRALAELQKQYVIAYLARHQSARMGAREAQRRDALRHDPRLALLDALSGLPVFPSGVPERLRARLDALVACDRLVTADLRATPVCPHCAFRPVSGAAPDAHAVLPHVETALDETVTAWSTQLLAALRAEFDRHDPKLYEPRDRGIVEVLLSHDTLPERLDRETLDAIRAVLRGVQPVVLDLRALARALVPGGGAVDLATLSRNFERHLHELTRDKNRDAVRVVLADDKKDPR